MSPQTQIHYKGDLPKSALNKINILLIDDDEAAHILHKLAIEEAGYDISNVKSCFNVDMSISELKSLIETNNEALWPEYIFLDINMPMKTGYDFIDEFSILKSEFKTPKIFLVSSSDNPNDIRKARDIELIHSFKTKFLDKEFISSLS